MSQMRETASPVLKWVGGKSKLLSEIKSMMPASFNQFHEPFAGGAALYLSLAPDWGSLVDINPHLINFYKVLSSRGQELLIACERLESEFNSLSSDERKSWFYDLRDKFNSAEGDELASAAYFLSLNKTSFNGLYRENSKGKFNVPFNQAIGRVSFINREKFARASSVMARATLTCGRFDQVLSHAQEGDFVYFDPPYVPLSATSAFTAYNSSGFGFDDQLELIAVAQELRSRGVSVMLSNSSSPWVLECYGNAGFSVSEVTVHRGIAANRESRSTIKEVLILGY